LFKSLQLSKTDAGFSSAIVDTDETQLPAGDVLGKVDYSTLNYKDGLAITNRAPVVRAWPMVAAASLTFWRFAPPMGSHFLKISRSW
jgi:acrylyl-CoA reductase (NADPH)